MNFEEDVKIDPDALDVMWLGQASLGLKYSKHAAQMKRVVMKAEERVKVVRAELIAEANANPVKLIGKEKPTAQDVESYYRTHQRHIDAKEEWLDATYESEYAQMAHMEISLSRKTALENLVKLHGMQYFAGPSAPRDISKEWENNQRDQKGVSDIASAMKERRRTK